MVSISGATRAKIKGYLEGFIEGLVKVYQGREKGKYMLDALAFGF